MVHWFLDYILWNLKGGTAEVDYQHQSFPNVVFSGKCYPTAQPYSSVPSLYPNAEPSNPTEDGAEQSDAWRHGPWDYFIFRVGNRKKGLNSIRHSYPQESPPHHLKPIVLITAILHRHRRLRKVHEKIELKVYFGVKNWNSCIQGVFKKSWKCILWDFYVWISKSFIPNKIIF